MDTRFWGPPAWKLLHSIAAGYDASPVMRRNMELFLEVLPYVLPCKFCRASLTDHYEKLPFRDALRSRSDLEHWVYKIHNLVNAKLGLEGRQILQPPAFRDVQEMYRQLIESSAFPSWDFLFAVAFIYPPQTKESPMPDAPAVCPAGAPDCVRNRWNKLPSGKRLQRWLAFWKVLPDVLPSTIASIGSNTNGGASSAYTWRSLWVSAWKAAQPSFTSRRSAIASIWRVRCSFESDKIDPYKNVCNRLQFHASGCGFENNAAQLKTCRRLTRKQR